MSTEKASLGKSCRKMYVSDVTIETSEPFVKIAFCNCKWEKLKSILLGLEWTRNYYLVLSRWYSIKFDKNSERGENFDYEYLNNCYGTRQIFTVDTLDPYVRNGLYLCHGLLIFCRKE